jgi:hypothetical protein
VAEARQGAQQFSQISLACPSNRRRAVDVVVDQIKVLFFHSMKDINVDYTLVNKHPKARFIFFSRFV